MNTWVAGLLGFACLGCSTAGLADERPAWVSEARLASAQSEPDNWLNVGHDYGDARFSPLRAINDANVAGLKLAWYYDFDTHRRRSDLRAFLAHDGWEIRFRALPERVCKAFLEG